MNNTDIAAHMALVRKVVDLVASGEAVQALAGYDAVEASARKLAAPERTEQAEPGWPMSCNPQCGLSWSGFNLFGDEKSIKEVKRLIHMEGRAIDLQRILEDERKLLTASPTAQPSVEPFDAFEGWTEHKTKETPYGPATSYKPVQPSVEPVGEREAFEAWFSEDGKWPAAVEQKNGFYKLTAADSAWRSWQAAWQAARTTPPPAPVLLSTDEIDAIFNEHHNPKDEPWTNWHRFARAIIEQAIGRASRGAR